MKELEEKIKDRVEGYESNLPDGDFAEFKALLDHSAATSNKRKMAYLAWLAPATVAAGLALFFIIGRDPEAGMIDVIENSPLVAEVITPEAPNTEADVAAFDATNVVPERPKRPHTPVVIDEEERNTIAPSESKDEGQDSEPAKSEPKDAGKRPDTKENPHSTVPSSIMPFHGSEVRRQVSTKVGQAAAGVLGGSGAVALAGLFPSMLERDPSSVISSDVIHDPGVTDPMPLVDERTMKDTHHMPLRAGLSLRIPFNDRWSLTTGLEYSWYSSTIGYSVSGDHKQNAHYLGIPIRADYTIARNRWLDVYVGAGASADFCIAAFEDGSRIAKDGIGFSLIGSGGVQFNITNNLGLFFDPTFSWNIPADNRILDTYKSDHPFMFSVSSGIRVTLQNKR